MLMSWLAETVYNLQKNKEDLILATVLSKSGSAPCSADAKMVVRSDGVIFGTVGGGLLEACVQKKAAQVFETGIAEIISFDLSGEEAANMEMICGGSVTLLVDRISASALNITIFQQLYESQKTGKKCYLVTSLGTVEEDNRQTTRYLIQEDGLLCGEFPYPQEWLDQLRQKSHHSSTPVVETIADEQFVIERCFAPSTLYICGAGHVSQQVSILGKMVDFHTVVLDDRGKFANQNRFPTADCIKILDSFDDCFADEELNSDSYVVIVTRGHQHDKTVLQQAMRTNAGYIGMIGSKQKRKELYKVLQHEGVSSKTLEKIHSPIGLAIKASTISEIAVSIIAELIQVRAQKTT